MTVGPGGSIYVNMDLLTQARSYTYRNRFHMLWEVCTMSHENSMEMRKWEFFFFLLWFHFHIEARLTEIHILDQLAKLCLKKSFSVTESHSQGRVFFWIWQLIGIWQKSAFSSEEFLQVFFFSIIGRIHGQFKTFVLSLKELIQYIKYVVLKSGFQVFDFLILFWSTRPIHITAGSDHYLHTWCLYVCRSVPTFQNPAKQNKFHVRVVTATGGTVGLAEWIIDGTHVLFQFFYQKVYTLSSFFSSSCKDVFDPPGPRPNRWLLFSQVVSVRPSVRKTKTHASALKPRLIKTKTRYVGAWWVTLKSPALSSMLFL